MIAIRVPTSEPWILEYNQQSTRSLHVKLTIHKQGGGGYWGYAPPGLVKSMVSRLQRVLSPPPLFKKIKPPPRRNPVYALDLQYRISWLYSDILISHSKSVKKIIYV